jgi:hypothetical protein
MGQGCAVPVDVHLIIVQLSLLLGKEEIATYTGVPFRTVKCILLYFKKHKTIKNLKCEVIKRGPPANKGLSREEIGVRFILSDI